MKVTSQSLFGFAQALMEAQHAANYARLQARLAAQAQRAIQRRQAELDKSHRRFAREQKRKSKTPDEHAQCGIRWYCRSPEDRVLGRYWKHCHACGQVLVYTSDPDAKPQVCQGRKP